MMTTTCSSDRPLPNDLPPAWRAGGAPGAPEELDDEVDVATTEWLVSQIARLAFCRTCCAWSVKRCHAACSALAATAAAVPAEYLDMVMPCRVMAIA